MKRYHRTTASQYLVIVAILASIVGIGLLGSFIMNQLPFSDHFAIPWAAARTWLLSGESPYAPAVVGIASEAIEESGFLGILPESQVFSQPLLTLLFYLPFSLIPYSISRVIWMTILSICVGFTGFISIRLSGWKLSTPAKLGVLIFVVLWPPSLYAILAGHLSPIIITLVMAGIYLIIQGQDTTAGFVLALTFSSFPTSGLILILLMIWSVSSKRLSVLTGMLSGFVFLITLSFLVLPSWFMDWASVMLNLTQGWEWVSTPLMDLAELLPGIARFLSIFLHAISAIYAIILLITILGQSGHIFIYKISAFFIFAYLLHIQGSIMFLLFVIPAMLLVFRFWSERWGLIGYLVSWVCLILVGAGFWLLIYSEINFTAPMDIPLITLGYPLFVLLGMIWIRWWALNIPKLPYESQ